MFDVYVLTLEQGKYYIGKSNNVQKKKDSENTLQGTNLLIGLENINRPA